MARLFCEPPSLLILPYSQAGAVVSIRQFTKNAMNHHHGMQSGECFGLGADSDGDGFTNELTVADLTAISIFQATLPVPGCVIPNDPAVERAALLGERLFDQIGCNHCHVDALPLTASKQSGPAWSARLDLLRAKSLQSRHRPELAQLAPRPGQLSSHGSCALGRPNQRPTPAAPPEAQRPRCRLGPHLHRPQAARHQRHERSQDRSRMRTSRSESASWLCGLLVGNCKFITRKLWGFYNQGGAFMHHGKFTTAREAVEAHNGEALAARQSFDALSPDDRNALIEFLKSFQVLPPGSHSLVVDELGRPKSWPPTNHTAAH